MCHMMKMKGIVLVSDLYYLFQGIKDNIVLFFLLSRLLVDFLKR